MLLTRIAPASRRWGNLCELCSDEGGHATEGDEKGSHASCRSCGGGWEVGAKESREKVHSRGNVAMSDSPSGTGSAARRGKRQWCRLGWAKVRTPGSEVRLCGWEIAGGNCAAFCGVAGDVRTRGRHHFLLQSGHKRETCQDSLSRVWHQGPVAGQLHGGSGEHCGN